MMTTTKRLLGNSIFFLAILILPACQTEKNNEKTEKRESRIFTSYQKTINQLTIPDWIKGSWGNIYISDLNRHLAFSFNDTELTIHSMNKENIHNIPIVEVDQHLVCNSTDSTFSFSFSEANDVYEVEFKLQQLDLSEDQHISYQLIKNGKIERPHSQSINLLFAKWNDIR